MSLLDTLDQEWEWMARSPRTSAAIARWDEAAVERFDHPSQIVEFVQERSHPIETDEVFRALVGRASNDALAARVVLQTLMPGMRAIVRRYGWAEQQDELCSMVIATGYEKIRRYPLERRPNRIASNIVNDTRRALHDRFVDIRAVEVPTSDIELDRFPRDGWTKTSADRLGELVTQAVKRGVVSQADGRLIVETRVFDTPIDSLAEHEGINAQSLRRRRLRAENRLAEADLPLPI